MAYSQQDPTWAHTILGFDSSDPNSKDYGTIGMYGCYVTAIANVCKWAGNDLNPVQINDICKQNGWFVSDDQIGRDDIPALLCSNLGFVGRTNWSGPTDMNFFEDASSPDVAYIIKIDSSPRVGIQSHFVMVWAKPDANDLTIDDSWDGVRKALSHYGTPSVVILSAMKFIKVAPPQPPAPPAPEPVVTPPPPLPPPSAPPAAPVPYTPAEKYTLLTTLMTFKNSQDAMSGVNGQSTLAAGTYYVFAKEGKAYNLSKDNMKNGNQWVNVLYNIIPAAKPIPVNPPLLKPSQVPIGPDNDTTWKATYRSFHLDRHSDPYKTQQVVEMKDYSGKRKFVTLDKDTTINVVGTFVKDGVTFYRPRANNDEFFSWYFGVSLYDDDGNLNLVKVVETDPEKIERRLSDIVHFWKDDLKDIWDIVRRKK